MNNLPLVTIIMPIRNEAAFIARSLGAVLAQNYPADKMEIIVIDGMSRDGTRNIVRHLQTNQPNLHLLDNSDQTVAPGLNIAVGMARGEIIVRVDGHCVIALDYVRRCVYYLSNEGVDAVGGPIETVGQTLVAQTIALAMSSSFGVGGSAFRTVANRTMLADTVAFPAYTRRILEQAGPFDEELVRNQDDEYNCRLRKLGAKILLAADIRSKYCSRISFRSLWRQYFQYGYWKVRVLQKHPQQMQPRQFAPLALVSALLVSTLLALVHPWGWWSVTLVLAAYTVSNLATSLWLARREGWAHLLRLPLVFAILHLSYGLGFLVGLFKFWNRWGQEHEGGSFIRHSDGMRAR